MILPSAVARGVAEGTVRLAFRRWAKPDVRPGSTLRTPAGVVEVESVEPVDPASITEDDAVLAGAPSAAAVRAALRGPEHHPTYRIRVRWAGPDPRVALGANDDLLPEEVEEISRRLARLDRAGRHGPWTRAVLEVVEAHPERRAGDLADLLGRDKQSFKLDVRKLKNLGLTHSLEVGYRLSPRGAAYLRAIRDRPAPDPPSR
ncbi:hypothetical protein B0I33_114184 [Prauserella shujinwangii]|uniref:ASCH domain-containing protein n=1 Tax=Prauserella shujinwangii TaxID=1453103 RepID=A0A2T0LLA4_9PSEU|nr:hypothetical protein [Prauserella shujinwangii]PRX43723.1 hypothetical protein B0I33_114184 [Prauserella shujinwangii]